MRGYGFLSGGVFVYSCSLVWLRRDSTGSDFVVPIRHPLANGIDRYELLFTKIISTKNH